MAGAAQPTVPAEVLGGHCPQKQPSVTDGSCPLEVRDVLCRLLEVPEGVQGPQVLKAGTKASVHSLYLLSPDVQCLGPYPGPAE